MNRYFRRLSQFGKGWSSGRSRGMRDTSSRASDASTPQDVASVRAKNSGHGKKTADKWNQ